MRGQRATQQPDWTLVSIVDRQAWVAALSAAILEYFVLLRQASATIGSTIENIETWDI